MDENEKKEPMDSPREDQQEGTNGQQLPEDSHEEEYSFVKEVIKDKPLDRRTVLKRMGWIAGAAVLFGLIAALVFSFTISAADQYKEKKDRAPKVNIPQEEEPSGEEEPGDDEEAEETPQEPVEVRADFTLEDYANLYKDMIQQAQEPKKALVTVTGNTSGVDWFNNPSESQRQISGLIVANNGEDLFVLTEYRVVDNVDRIQITFCDNTTVDARFQKADSNTDLSILKVPLSEVPQETQNSITVATLGSSYGVNQGEPVIAIGSPMGYSDSIAYGLITSVTNTVNVVDGEYNLLTTDIMGSSDGSGILVNLNGEVVGVIAQSYGLENSKNIVTALAISQIKELIEQLSNNTDNPYAGIKGMNVTEEIAANTGMPKGVFVDMIAEDSPAMQAGIQKADVITAVKGNEVATVKQYQSELKKCGVGEVIKIKVMRKGAEGYVELEYDVTLTAS